MPRRTIDWQRVARVLRARRDDELTTCPLCRAQGSVPYVAEHVLATHPESKEGRALARIVLGEGSRSA